MLIRALRRARPPLVALVLSFSLILRLGVALPQVTMAQDVPHLDTTITDETGVLVNDRAAIQDELQRLLDKTGVQLYVLVVNTTGETDIAQYAVNVGEGSQLGPTDALLVIAVQDKTDNISIGSDLRDNVSQTALDDVRTGVLEPALARGDFGGAVIEAAGALESVFPAAGASNGLQTTTAVATPAPTDTQAPASTSAKSNSDAGSSLIVVLVVMVVLVGLLLVGGRIVRDRAKKSAASDQAGKQG